MKIRTIALVLGLALAIASAPALAAAGDMKIRFGGAHVDPTGDNTVVWYDEPPEYEASEFKSDSDISGFVGFEVMINDFVGLDTTILSVNINVEEEYIWTNNGEVLDAWHEDIADILMTPFFFSAHFHFLNNGPIDLYAGPTVAYVWYGDWDYDSEFEDFDLRVDADFGYGGVIGIDLPFGSSRWMLSSAVRYIKTGAELNETGFAHELGNFTLDIDPWIVQVGVGVKF